MFEAVLEKLYTRLTLKFVEILLFLDVAKLGNSTIADFVNCEGY